MGVQHPMFYFPALSNTITMTKHSKLKKFTIAYTILLILWFGVMLGGSLLLSIIIGDYFIVHFVYGALTGFVVVMVGFELYFRLSD